jgi:hypothetical protein
MDDLFSP